MSYLTHQFARQFVVITFVVSVASICFVETLKAETVANKSGMLGVDLDLSESFTLSVFGRLKNGHLKNDRLKGKSSSANFMRSFNAGSSDAYQRAYDDYRLELSSFAAMIDWHPGSSGFRVSAGLLHNGKEPDNATHSVADSNYLIRNQGHTAYELGGLADRIESDSTAPYLGIGWRNKVDDQGGFRFSAEAGLLFQGGSTSHLATKDNLITSQDYFQEEDSFEDFLDNVEIYPVLNLGISYTY